MDPGITRCLQDRRCGEGTFDRVMKGFSLLKKYKVDFNILCTVNAVTAIILSKFTVFSAMR